MRPALLVLLLSAIIFPLRAEKYALLIGINRYTGSTRVNNLEGAVNDAAALRQTLVADWQFKTENVRLLADSDASRAAVLEALDHYIATLKPNDFLFLFYSGHGTSYFAPGMPQTGISVDTGAILSADLQLIVGNRDLQPRLRKLDGIAQVFAVFDSCYSGNSIKSIAVAVPKFALPGDVKTAPGSLAQYDSQFSDFNRFTTSESYPYRRVLFFSAASKAEQAFDIQRPLIATGFRTVDGQAHGALTNALLRGLRGEADTNHDSKITYDELYQFVRANVTRQFSQTPQFSFPESDPKAAQSPVFSVTAAAPAPPPQTVAVPAAIRVKVEGDLPALRTRIAALPGVTLSDGFFDLLVRARSGGYELYHQSGTLIDSYPGGGETDLLSRIKAEPAVRRLIDIVYPRQNFNVALTVTPGGTGFYKLGDHMQFQAKTEQPAYLLLLNIDVKGTVTILSPRSKQAIVFSGPGPYSDIGPDSVVTRPTGTEYLALFAFREKPTGFDDLVIQTHDPLDPGTPAFDRLVLMLAQDVPGRAVAQLKLVTTE
jgi:hypothetical protein